MSLISRVIGEAVGTGTAARADQKPPRTQPEVPPKPEGPDDSVYHSLADQRQQDAAQRSGEKSELDLVSDMWRSGSKYDACKYMLFSNFAYTDFVRLIQGLPRGEGLEMGGILDELAPPYEGEQYRPSDLVSAAAGGPMTAGKEQQ